MPTWGITGIKCVVSLLALTLSVIAFAENESGACGDEVASTLWVPGSTLSRVPQTKNMQSDFIGAKGAHLSIQSELYNHLHFLRAHYFEDYRAALAESKEEGLEAEDSAKAHADRELQKRVDLAAKAKKEAGDQYLILYFGLRGRGITGAKLRNLTDAALIQLYLAKWNEVIVNRLAQIVGPHGNFFEASAQQLGQAAELATCELLDPPKELSVLRRLTMIARPSCYSIEAGANGKIEAAYLRASQADLAAATSSAEAFVLDPALPDFIRNFALDYTLGAEAFTHRQTHPLLVDWAAKVRAYQRDGE